MKFIFFVVQILTYLTMWLSLETTTIFSVRSSLFLWFLAQKGFNISDFSKLLARLLENVLSTPATMSTISCFIILFVFLRELAFSHSFNVIHHFVEKTNFIAYQFPPCLQFSLKWSSGLKLGIVQILNFLKSIYFFFTIGLHVNHDCLHSSNYNPFHWDIFSFVFFRRYNYIRLHRYAFSWYIWKYTFCIIHF